MMRRNTKCCVFRWQNLFLYHIFLTTFSLLHMFLNCHVHVSPLQLLLGIGFGRIQPSFRKKRSQEGKQWRGPSEEEDSKGFISRERKWSRQFSAISQKHTTFCLQSKNEGLLVTNPKAAHPSYKLSSISSQSQAPQSIATSHAIRTSHLGSTSASTTFNYEFRCTVVAIRCATDIAKNASQSSSASSISSCSFDSMSSSQIGWMASTTSARSSWAITFFTSCLHVS